MNKDAFMSNANKTKMKPSIEQVPDDILLNLLRTHLVLEGLLKEFIKAKAENPKHLHDLGFYKTLYLAKSLSKDSKLQDLWDALEQLNGLRNKLAHYFSPKDFDSKLETFVEFVEKKFSIKKKPEKIEDRTILATATLLNFFAPIALDKMKP